MNKVISDKIKTSIIEQVIFGDDVGALAEKYRVSKSSIYRWVRDYKSKQKYNTDNLLTLAQMKRNMDRATQKLHILSSAPCGANSPLLPRYKYIETIEDITKLNNDTVRFELRNFLEKLTRKFKRFVNFVSIF